MRRYWRAVVIAGLAALTARAAGVRAAAVAFVLGAVALGCPLPVAHTEVLSPPVVGVVRRSDGGPLDGAPVVLAPGYGRSGDAACAGPAVARTATDAAGAFQLPAVRRRYRVTWVVPLFDQAAPAFRLCVGGAGVAADTLRPAYRGYVWSRGGRLEPDSVTCLEWAWQGRSRVACSGRSERALVTGGRWTEGASSGSYRLLLTEEGPIKGPDGRAMRPRLVIQWVEEPAPGAPATVRVALWLPADDRFRSLRELRNARLGRLDGRWCMSVESTRWTFLDADDEEDLAFELGPPGQASPVPTCGGTPEP